MASHSFTVDSNLTIGEAYARAVDLEQVPAWDDGVQSSVRLPDGDDGAARFDVTVTGFDGKPSSVVYTITESDAPNRFVMVGENATFRAVDTLAFTGAGDSSKLDYHGTLELLGDTPPLSPGQLDSMFPKIAAVAEAGLTRYLNP
ncbi:MAG: SRPBCC family protein [Ilumatobacter sp.]|uniref:SRPBCC family protein n=1 Tax=Ilumatobacter sp. TaxID=1967498 RepID=UPI003C78EE75